MPDIENMNKLKFIIDFKRFKMSFAEIVRTYGFVRDRTMIQSSSGATYGHCRKTPTAKHCPPVL